MSATEINQQFEAQAKAKGMDLTAEDQKYTNPATAIAWTEYHAAATTSPSAPQYPAYRSHKTVQAFKIKSIAQTEAHVAIPGGSWKLYPEDGTLHPAHVTHAWYEKHQPAVGGYLVQYADGYQSFSPAKAFEEGNTLIGGEPSIYQPAIRALERAADTCEHNAPIHATEGNAEQAACSKANGEGYRAAIAYLETLSA